MPTEYYSLYNQDGFEVGEDMPEGLQELDSFMVFDDEGFDTDEVMTVEDDEEEEMYALVPGSEEKYVEQSSDDTMEVRETSWEEDSDHAKFIGYIKDKITKIPRHTGKTVPGCERALSYLKSCEQEISKAMRSDLKGEIDEEEIDKLRKDLHNMMDRLENHIDRLRKSAGLQKVNFVTESDMQDQEGLSKEAGLPVLNVYMTPFERACVGIMINAKVQGGKNIEEVYAKLKNKYNFEPREELAIQQLLADHGYPVYKDRGLINEPTDPTSGDNLEWQTNYYA